MLRKIILNIAIFLFMAAPVLSFAAGFNPNGGELGNYLRNLNSFFNGVVVPFLLGIGFLYFVWGMFQYFIKGGEDEDAQKAGKQKIIYATLGFVVIFIFWGMVELLTDFTGLKDKELDRNLIPQTPLSN